MAAEKNYLAIGVRRFGFHPGSSHHIARRFAALNYRVGWISYFLSPFHFFGAEDRTEFQSRLKIWQKGGSWHDDGRIWSYVPFTLLPIVDRPVLRSEWVLRHSDRLTIPRFSRKIAKTGFRKAEVLWIDSSRYSFALDRIPHRVSIFRPSEDITLLPDVAQSFLDHERDLVDRADLVLAHSRVMIESYKKLTPRPIHYFPNAVEFDFFHGAPDTLPDEYRSIPPPRVVCLGGLASPLIFDQDLIAHLARALPGRA
jgi:hypothetical protein